MPDLPISHKLFIRHSEILATCLWQNHVLYVKGTYFQGYVMCDTNFGMAVCSRSLWLFRDLESTKHK